MAWCLLILIFLTTKIYWAMLSSGLPQLNSSSAGPQTLARRSSFQWNTQLSSLWIPPVVYSFKSGYEILHPEGGEVLALLPRTAGAILEVPQAMEGPWAAWAGGQPARGRGGAGGALGFLPTQPCCDCMVLCVGAVGKEYEVSARIPFVQ